jgi:hypothetical protein
MAAGALMLKAEQNDQTHVVRACGASCELDAERVIFGDT